MNFDYSTEYDKYWSSKDRFGEQSFADADVLAEEILLSCGGGKVLDIGSGMGQLVRGLLRLGIDAYGVDVSQVAVTHANAFAPHRFFCESILNLPFETAEFDTVVSTDCLEHLSEQDVVNALKEMRRVARRSVFLKIATTPDRDGHWHLTIQQRAWWEQRFFEVGFRKHPSYYQINQYEALEHDSWQITIVLERIPDQALANYPLATLAAERDLHMDMLRETGARSDAHVGRYQWATQYVRPGDTVLDAACGLGYGSYVLQLASTAARTIGIDGSQYAIEYANQNFAAAVPNLEFRCGMLPEVLADIPDHSIDIVLSFETLEHVHSNVLLLIEFHRVLTPGGRLLVSVPNDWSDETGQDPNPFHVHVYTLTRLRNELREKFCLEALVAQTASQCKTGADRKTWRAVGRSMVPTAIDVSNENEPEAEWWLAVATRSPLDGAMIPYRETAHPTFKHPQWNVTTYAQNYENPWLVKSMVDIGHRISNKTELLALAEKVFATAKLNAPDKGAALCVLAYQLLSDKNATAIEIMDMNRRISAYVSSLGAAPHEVRWKISLLFVQGKLWLEMGEFTEALATFENCVSIDPLGFSPLLSNRTVEACLILGQLCLLAGDQSSAQTHWRRGIRESQRATQGDWHAALGDISNPAEFGLPELASILEYASSCAYALAHINESDSKYWWWLHTRRDRLSQTIRLKKDLEFAQLHLQILTTNVNAKQQELDLQGSYIQTFKEDIQQKQHQLEHQIQYIETLKKEIADKQVELAMQGRDIEIFKADIAGKQHELTEQGEHILGLQKEITVTRQFVDELRNEMSLNKNPGLLLEKEEYIIQLTAEIANKQNDLSLQGDHITLLKADIAAKQQELAEQGTYIAEFKVDIDIKQKALNEQQNHIISLDAEIKSRQQELALQGEHINAFKTEIDSLKHLIDAQLLYITALKSEIETKKDEIALQGSHITELTADISKKQNELTLQTEYTEQLKNEISVQLAETDSLKTINALLESNLQIAENKLSRIPTWLRRYL